MANNNAYQSSTFTIGGVGLDFAFTAGSSINIVPDSPGPVLYFGDSLEAALTSSAGISGSMHLLLNDSTFAQVGSTGLVYQGFYTTALVGTWTITGGPSVATPEPSTLISGGMAGLLGLGYGWRRRDKAKLANRMRSVYALQGAYAVSAVAVHRGDTA